MLRSSNPALREGVFTRFENVDLSPTELRPRTMTIGGTVNCTFILLGLCAAAAVMSWGWLMPDLTAIKAGSAVKMPVGLIGATLGSTILGLVLSLVIGFKPTTAPWLAPVYALTQGVFVGSISATTAAFYPQGQGLVLLAAVLTFGILASLLAVYRTGLIKPSENFKLGVAAATGGVCLLMLGWMVIRLIFPQTPGLMQLGWLGIAISGAMVVLASLNLVMDFDFIEEGAANGAPKHMEWYAAFGLLVTLVWLYIELLRLLKMLAANRE
jgi:uncharacterized YccA/Bax inhibitor family protein